MFVLCSKALGFLLPAESDFFCLFVWLKKLLTWSSLPFVTSQIYPELWSLGYTFSSNDDEMKDRFSSFCLRGERNRNFGFRRHENSSGFERCVTLFPGYHAIQCQTFKACWKKGSALIVIIINNAFRRSAVLGRVLRSANDWKERLPCSLYLKHFLWVGSS